MIHFKKISALFTVTIFSIVQIKAMQEGRLELICGPMFSGKTTELIRRIEQAEASGEKVLALKHVFDNRYDKQDIVSHDKKKHGALTARDEPRYLQEILELAQKYDVVAIDEIQFFQTARIESILQVINILIIAGKRIIVAGLDLDFRKEDFPIMPTLTGFADEVTKLQATCSVCKKAADYSQRLIDGQPAAYNDPVIMIGPDELYEPRCQDCFVIRK